MNADEVAHVPSEFLRLWDFAHQTINPPRQQQSTGLYVLPVSLRRSAEIVEESDIYRQFINAALFDPMPSAWQAHDSRQNNAAAEQGRHGRIA